MRNFSVSAPLALELDLLAASSLSNEVVEAVGGVEVVVVEPSSWRATLLEKDREKCDALWRKMRSCRRVCTKGLATL